VIDTIPQSIYWKGADSVYLCCNQNFLDDLGKRHRDEVIQHTDAQICADADEAYFTHEDDKRVMHNGVAEYHKVTPSHLANGEKVYLDISRIPLLNEVGNVVGLLGTYENITDQIAAKAEKRALEAQVRRSEKMKAIGTLAGGVAHDLNNILSGLVSYPDLLLMDIERDSPMRPPIEKIKQSGQRAAAIVQDLLTLSRRGVENKVPLQVTALVADYVRSPELQQLLEANPGVQLRHDGGEGILPVMGTGFQLAKVIMNLVSNAVEAIEDEGFVEIEVFSCYLDRSQHGFEEIPPGEYTCLKVSDTGKGISDDDLGRIFEPFYTKKVMGRSGTGLGLAVVWGILKDHEGCIDVISEQGQGTTFRLYLPAHRSPLETETEVTLDAYMGKGETILIVDDMPEQREIASIMLTKLGYQTFAVASGEEALKHQRRQPADLLLLDMIMEPGIDGLETFQRIRDFNPRQRAIIASGFSESKRVKAAIQLGAGAYVRKPYSLESIGIAIRRELDCGPLSA
jgi:signal transduction histidine kinase/CheY-like chemotaxis protein